MAELQILEKCRLALMGVMSNIEAAPMPAILNEKSAVEKTAPCIVCGASNAQEEIMGTGNFNVEFSVEIKTRAAETGGEAVDHSFENESNKIVAAAFAVLEVDDLPAQLAAAAAANNPPFAFTLFGWREEKRIEFRLEEDYWAEIWKRTGYCCGSSF